MTIPSVLGGRPSRIDPLAVTTSVAAPASGMSVASTPAADAARVAVARKTTPVVSAPEAVTEPVADADSAAGLPAKLPTAVTVSGALALSGMALVSTPAAVTVAGTAARNCTAVVRTPLAVAVADAEAAKGIAVVSGAVVVRVAVAAARSGICVLSDPEASADAWTAARRAAVVPTKVPSAVAEAVADP